MPKAKSFQDAVADIASDSLATAPTAPPPTTYAAPEAVSAPADTAVAIPAGDGGFTGSMDKSDIVIPRLSVVQKVGDLSELFPPGTVVLNKRLVLANIGEALTITVVRARKYFMEALPFGDERRPRMFDDHHAVAAAGLSVVPKWQSGVDPTAKPVLDCVIAIHGKPGNDTAPEFAMNHDGQRYALALWSIGSPSAYNSVAKALLSAKQMYLKSFVEQQWLLTVTKEKFGTNTVFVPSVKPSVGNSVDAQKFLDSIV